MAVIRSPYLLTALISSHAQMETLTITVEKIQAAARTLLQRVSFCVNIGYHIQDQEEISHRNSLSLAVKDFEHLNWVSYVLL